MGCQLESDAVDAPRRNGSAVVSSLYPGDSQAQHADLTDARCEPEQIAPRNPRRLLGAATPRFKSEVKAI